MLEYDFYIILSGLGFITADNLGQMLIEKAKVVASSIVSSTTTTQPTIPSQPTVVTNTTTTLPVSTITQQPVDETNIPEN